MQAFMDKAGDALGYEEREAERELAEVGPGPLGAKATDEEKDLFRLVRYIRRLETERDRVADQMGAILKGLDARISYVRSKYGPQMEQTTRQLLEGKKERSIKTPFGTVGFHLVGQRVICKDEKALAESGANHLVKMGDDQTGHFVLFEEVKRIKPSFENINSFFDLTGEVPPGCELIEDHDSFYVK